MASKQEKLIEALGAAFVEQPPSFDIVGFITRDADIYPLGTDTKVLSTVFELLVRPLIVKIANEHGYTVVEPTVQNHYPDFTLIPTSGEKAYVALDIKTTYRRNKGERFGYTLGGYTSFIKEETPTKNIVFPFGDYAAHWVIGFVYTRVAEKKAAAAKLFKIDQMKEIVSPYEDVELFFQEKWRVAGDYAGSGNTTNIGSIFGTLEDFKKGNGPFTSEQEYLDYWRSYGRTSAVRTYSNIKQFRAQRKG